MNSSLLSFYFIGDVLRKWLKLGAEAEEREKEMEMELGKERQQW